MTKTVSSFAAGKLFIAGEYAVTIPGEPAILIAVDRGITCTITSVQTATDANVESDIYGTQRRTWHFDGEFATVAGLPFDYLSAALTIAERYRAANNMPQQHYSVRITSTLADADGTKYGLGSSGAVITAVVSALSQFYGLFLTRFRLFQFCLLASVMVSPKGSGGDIAASVYSGWVFYHSPDREKLAADLAEYGLLRAMRSDGWEGCAVQSFSALNLPAGTSDAQNFPAQLQPLIAWTGRAADTDTAVTSLNAKTLGEDFWDVFLENSRCVVTELWQSVQRLTQQTNDQEIHFERIKTLITAARKLLRELSRASGHEIETAELKTLCDLAEAQGAAAKSSGAGGGDCGIVFCEEEQRERVIAAWESAQIKHLNLKVSTGREFIKEA